MPNDPHSTKFITENGSAAVEFALCLPVLAILVCGAAELGFTLYQGNRVSDAAEAGMLYASQNGYNAPGISAAITGSTGIPGISASPAPSQFYGCPTATGITTVASSSSTCANGNTPGTYVSVNVLLTRQKIIAVPGLSLPSTLSAKSIIRIN